MAKKSPATALRDASDVAADLRLTSRDVYGITIDSIGTRIHLSTSAFTRIYRKVADDRSALKAEPCRKSIHCEFGYRSITFLCVLMGKEAEDFRASIEHKVAAIAAPSNAPRIAHKPSQQLLLTDNDY